MCVVTGSLQPDLWPALAVLVQTSAASTVMHSEVMNAVTIARDQLVIQFKL